MPNKEDGAKKRGRKPKKASDKAKKAADKAKKALAVKAKKAAAKAKKVADKAKKTPTNVVRKKRGRKPKGGKIVKKIDITNKINKKIEPNVILHLKCFTADLKDKDTLFSGTTTSIQSYPFVSSKLKNMIYEEYTIQYPLNDSSKKPTHYSKEETKINEIWEKIRLLKFKLHKNDILDKKSDCFWCNYGFSNPPIFIPKNERNGIIEVYGCFCSPECAVAYLKKESIDTSTIWERYALLNNIYGKIYNYKKNIKPAPNPYYTLEKYYGNLSIQEYRKLLQNDRILLVVDKPMTKIMPELYEENNDIPTIYSDILNMPFKSSHTQKYRLQRKVKKTSKNRILKETFNLINK